MNSTIKLLIGVLLVLGGLWLVIPVSLLSKPTVFDWYGPFVTMIKGLIPPLLVFLGVIIIWIEREEMKTPNLEEIEREEAGL